MDECKIIKKSFFKTTNWGGGNTTELFIYPENSIFKENNYNFRISTATVETEKSTFTILAQTHRHLTLLDGELTLNYKNESHKIPLFETHEFEGEWETSSIGKCVDFNLMTKVNCKAEVNAFKVYKNSTFKDRNLDDFTFIYIYKGKIKCSKGIAKEGDLILINKRKLFQFDFLEESIIVHATLTLL